MTGVDDGDLLGISLGTSLGTDDGDLLGISLGTSLGTDDGDLLGWLDGFDEGTSLGIDDGDLLGTSLGTSLDSMLGALVEQKAFSKKKGMEEEHPLPLPLPPFPLPLPLPVVGRGLVEGATDIEGAADGTSLKSSQLLSRAVQLHCTQAS